jgi:hypothetical protein
MNYQTIKRRTQELSSPAQEYSSPLRESNNQKKTPEPLPARG